MKNYNRSPLAFRSHFPVFTALFFVLVIVISLTDVPPVVGQLDNTTSTVPLQHDEYSGFYIAETEPSSIINQAEECHAAAESNFLFLPFHTEEDDWLSLMTAAFDHHYPDYTCSQGLTETCTERGMEIAIWESEVARPIVDKESKNLCYATGPTPTLETKNCGWVSGYYGVTGETAIYYDGHDGYDWAIPGGNVPILAAAGGRVTNVWTDGAYGWTVEIDHLNGYKTRYSHLQNGDNKQDNHNPEPGSCILAASQIGVQGCTGRCTGPHLHFRVLHNGNLTDPFGWCFFCRPHPSPDPLQAYNGETSQNLWFENNPQSVGYSPARKNISLIWDAFNSKYLGGPGLLPEDELNASYLVAQNENPIVKSGEPISLTFTIRNTGVATWEPSIYFLVLSNGDGFGLATKQNIPSPISPNQDITWNLSFSAPHEPGLYNTHWQMGYQTSAGELETFGSEIFYNVIVSPEDGSSSINEWVRLILGHFELEFPDWRFWENWLQQIELLIHAGIEILLQLVFGIFFVIALLIALPFIISTITNS